LDYEGLLTVTRDGAPVFTVPGYSKALAEWLNDMVQPDAFVTVNLPVINPARDHQFYLNLWTRMAEAKLWGRTSLEIANHDDRPLWFFVNEKRSLNHFHAACRLPTRPMLTEHDDPTRSITVACHQLQDALVQASRTTPEPFKSPLASLRGADILVKPWETVHGRYMFKENTELFIFPHLPRRARRAA
jgi:hypothetical protein